MEIERLGEFAAYCQERGDDPALAEQVAFVERWADISERASAQYGIPMEKAVDWARTYLDNEARDEDKTKVNDQSTLETSRDVLTRFWTHRKAFSKWFASKVIVIGTDTPQETFTPYPEEGPEETGFYGGFMTGM